MMGFVRKVCCLILLAVTPAVMAWNSLTADLDLTCNQDNTNLKCDYRLLRPALTRTITASAGKQTLTVSGSTSFPVAGNTVAVLFLVDTSDPARENVVKKNIEHIEKLLTAGKSYHRFGLASFDKNLIIEAPVGTSRSQIIDASRKLQAIGKTTELYRNVIKAIDVMAGVNADRKAIYLFSDGQAEDRAYFNQDVTRAARKANVIINSLGYPRSTTLSVALQTIRRLSEESGGLYVETDGNFNLPGTFLNAPFQNIDSGGEFTVDLAPILTKLSPPGERITVVLNTATGSLNTAVPVTNPFAAATRTTAAVPVSSPEPASPEQTQPVRIIAPIEEPNDIDLWLWYGIPVAFVILIVLTMIILIVTYQQLKVPKASSSKSDANAYKPFAYLVVQDESGIRYPITNTTWRIGRTRDNELVLDDKSVSRKHAEIQRYRNGNFIIYDVDSLNGVFVNSEQVKKKKLQEGDIIEIGDIYLRFTTQAANYSIEDDTAIQNTRTPMIQ